MQTQGNIGLLCCDSFGVENVRKEIKGLDGNKKIIANIFLNSSIRFNNV